METLLHFSNTPQQTEKREKLHVICQLNSRSLKMIGTELVKYNSTSTVYIMIINVQKLKSNDHNGQVETESYYICTYTIFFSFYPISSLSLNY